jgi:hypothetical protein
MDPLIAKYLSEGGEIKKIEAGFAIGYTPHGDATHEIDDLANDTINVMICALSPLNGGFLAKKENAISAAINEYNKIYHKNTWIKTK